MTRGTQFILAAGVVIGAAIGGSIPPVGLAASFLAAFGALELGKLVVAWFRK